MSALAKRSGRGASRARAGSRAGFTLVELLVVMGILAGFLLMLVQLVDGGLTMFRDGEAGQQLADRSSNAQRVITDRLRTLRGSATGRDRRFADDRLVVQMLPFGLPEAVERGATLVQVLRGAVHLDVERELEIVDTLLAARVLAEDPEMALEALTAEVEKRRMTEPLRGVGNMIMLPWLQAGDDDALLELRAGSFLPGQTFPVGPGRMVDPFEVPVPGSPELPGLLVWQITEPILSDLLHVEFALWAQTTTSWGSEAGALHDAVTGSLQRSDPQPLWDSARGGWLVDRQSGGQFLLDVGPTSENDVSDDIHPHAILVRCVVAEPQEAAPEGLLGYAISEQDTSLTLIDGTRWPGSRDGGFCKLGREWVYYSERDGDRLLGLRRGQRATMPREHAAGTRLHIGRTVEFVVPILHQKDDWNG